ncbi:AhpC/TSA antioxidant enzyme-domain-containing protein [Chaetomium fimeti]|uniref:AhpC/TSA antioxidant enzyme-domain-containing protein n=1 Tax=Chaetomium fimeti TaxID=1854472 RepID=A0AAE0HIE3_9PEZI|nr:AhpC/TSA antioxidant enzyme-domain-containing protein [Chaetomium fimeti]
MASSEATPETAAVKNGADPAAKQSIERKPVAAGQSGSPPPVTIPASSATPLAPAPAPVPAPAPETPEKPEVTAVTADDGVNPLDFEGSVETNHDLPTLDTIRKIDNYTVLDRDGKSHTFRSLYTGRHTARRVLIIFIRHFFCGNCQQYLRTLSESITPPSLLALPHSTFICVVGCGDPALIDMYADAAACPFPIYADPTRRLYAELGMVRTLALGPRPAYIKTHLVKSSALSVVQGLKQIGKGLALRGGDSKQVGGEFLFEPVGRDAVGGGMVVATTPVGIEPPKAWTTTAGDAGGGGAEGEGEGKSGRSETSLDGKGEPDSEGEDKVVTWCHRMQNTRDHAEVPELMEVLGLDGDGRPVGDKERWERAVRERKGTGVSLAGRTSKEVGVDGTVL